MKKVCLTVLPALTIVLELLPLGAVCIFATSPTERVKETFSYFSLTPFGYANFAPLITATLTVAIFLLSLFSLKKKGVLKALFVLSIITVVISLLPLMYGFVILLILMGFTSVISTLTTNIRIRSREFAVLKSVGMTNKSLCRMLYSESIFCVLNALVPGVILGIAIPFLINLSIRKAFPVLYHIPWAALFGGIFVLIGIVFSITRTEIHKLRDKSIIDEIRMDIV